MAFNNVCGSSHAACTRTWRVTPMHDQRRADPVLRRASAADGPFLLTLRNHPTVVALSSSQRIIHPDEHQRWLDAMLTSELNLLLIVDYTEDCIRKIGYARIDCREENIASVTVVLIPEYQDKGLGTSVIQAVCKLGFLHWPKLQKILAIIRKENTRSYAAFTKSGFIEADVMFQQPDHHVLMIHPF